MVDGESYSGRVTRVAGEVSGSQVLANVAFDDVEPRGLRQNQRVSTRLVLEEKLEVLKVPRGPFLESNGGRWVYRVIDGMLHRTTVDVGAISVTEVEILGGLDEGDAIVLSDMTLYDGTDSLLLID